MKLCIPIKKEICGINKGVNIIHSNWFFFIFKYSNNSTHIIVSDMDNNETMRGINIEVNINDLFW